MVQAPRSAILACTSSRVAISSGRGLATKRAGGYVGGALELGRTSAAPPSSRVAISSGRGLATKRAGGYVAGSLEIGRPSAPHFPQPPSSTAAASKPRAGGLPQVGGGH